MKKMFLMIAAATFALAACNTDKTTTNDEKTGDSKMSSSTEDNEERNKKVVLDDIQDFNKGDTTALTRNLAADVIDYFDGSTPPAKGIDSVKAALQIFVTSFTDMKIDPIMTFADGDYVIVYSDWSGTFKNDFMGMKATGKSFKVNDADIFKLNDEGKITEHRSVQSMATIMQQIGAQPPK